jgi:hypothetical protein
MIMLPIQIRRTYLISFWLVMSAIIGLLIGGLGSSLISPYCFVFGLMLAVCMALVGLRWPQCVLTPYRFWNKLAYGIARVLSLVLLGVCFFTIFIFARLGSTRSSLRLDRKTDGESMWISRGTLPPIAYLSMSSAIIKDPTEKCWILTFLSWVVQSGNFWAFCLLPFMILLRFLDAHQDRGFPANIYTLF